MIKLSKGPIPEKLKKYAQEWTERLLERLNKGELPTSNERHRYRDLEIKNALIAETHGKCAYCESKLRHVSHGDVEHIVPKSLAPLKTFEWKNLTLACEICNRNKGVEEGLLDPYIDDPEACFFFAGPLLIPMPGNELAKKTEMVLELNRAELLEIRRDKIRHLTSLFDIMVRTQDPSLRELLRRDIERRETTSEQEFTAQARAFITLVFRELAGVRGS
jgi:uncharacterized protein (TIGR02646 family)